MGSWGRFIPESGDEKEENGDGDDAGEEPELGPRVREGREEWIGEGTDEGGEVSDGVIEEVLEVSDGAEGRGWGCGVGVGENLGIFGASEAEAEEHTDAESEEDDEGLGLVANV